MPDRPHFNTKINSAFRPEPVNANTVISTIKVLNATSSLGSDGIVYIFSGTSSVIIPSFTCIVNTSLVAGVFPEAWEYALVVPLYKNGDPNCVSKFRPVSILPLVFMILENIIANQISYYLETIKLLCNSQHGFRPKLSTETALTTITDKYYDNIDNKNISMLILFDNSKAFHTVSNKTLLNRCSLLNIDNLLFNSYLHNRRMSAQLE